ncbi:hypothetical protein [Arthrobacter sp. D2-10]
MSPKRGTVRNSRQAHQRAAELGELQPMEPASRRVDGSPRVGTEQVYVTRTGTVFHPAWCSSVADKWDTHPEGLLVIAANTAGKRRQCVLCDSPIGD